MYKEVYFIICICDKRLMKINIENIDLFYHQLYGRNVGLGFKFRKLPWSSWYGKILTMILKLKKHRNYLMKIIWCLLIKFKNISVSASLVSVSKGSVFWKNFRQIKMQHCSCLLVTIEKRTLHCKVRRQLKFDEWWWYGKRQTQIQILAFTSLSIKRKNRNVGCLNDN